MTSGKKPESAAADARAGADLRRQYRPIGIGAVAAALSAAGKDAGNRTQNEARGADNSNERISDPAPLAA